MAKGGKNSLLNKDGTLNKANYDKKVRKQQETFAQIDGAMSILEKLPDMADTALGLLDTRSISLSMSPLGFLFNILKQLGVSEETLREWIVEILIYTLPAVEMGLKASLLSNLKSLVSCNADPRIPWWMRKNPNSQMFRDVTQFEDEDERGLIINLDAIDPEGMLTLSPFTQPGMTKYFGCVPDKQLSSTVQKVLLKLDLNDASVTNENVLENVTVTGVTGNLARTVKLVRADDFNAFLWYVIHKGNKQNPIPIEIRSNGAFTSPTNGVTYYLNKTNLRGVTILTAENDSDISEFSVGTTFYDIVNPDVISIFFENKYDDDEDRRYAVLIEISSDWFSCNWYVDKSNYYGANTGLKKKADRDYSSEKAICNIRYSKETDFRGRPVPGSPDNLIFTILPKPAIVLPAVAKTTEGKVAVQSRIVRLLFDADGTPNSKGKYTLNSESIAKKDIEVTGTTITIDGVTVEINKQTGKYKLVNQEQDSKKLIECYPGLTVYEFNYDFVMGMKLFDPKVICQRIIENAFNPKYNADFNFAFSFNKLKDKSVYPFYGGKQRLIEVVREILEEDEDEINDCFFNFSNETYEEMLNASEEIRYNKAPYDNGYDETSGIDMSAINDILGEYPENGTLEEQKDVINRALMAATGLISGEEYGTNGTEGITTNAKSKSTSIKVDFLTNILESLIAAIVDSLLSPKLLLLLAVNKQLMSDSNEGAISVKSLMSLMKNLLKSLVREVRDLIMQKILDYILKTLAPIALQIQAKIASEQFQAYLMIIKLLLSWFNKGLAVVTSLSSILNSLFSKFKKRFKGNGSGVGGDYSTFATDIDLPSVLDDIMYADIYPEDAPEKTPIIENC